MVLEQNTIPHTHKGCREFLSLKTLNFTFCAARVLTLSLFLFSCQGTISQKPPIHLVQNMDNQAKFQPQEPNPFFNDGRSMRPHVAGTVARGALYEDAHLYKGMNEGKLATTLPMELNGELLARGRERYDIYCSMCHGRAGFGDGIVIRRGMIPPPSFHEERLRNVSVGHLYNVVTDGVRNMAAYKSRIAVNDRWAIAAYVRALQLSRVANIKQVPEDIAMEKGWKSP